MNCFSNSEVPEYNSTDAAGKPQIYDENRILICNNACWALGEIAMKIPEQIKPIFKDVINSLADLLNSNILSDLQSSQNSDQILKHFTKTISITLGRLGKLDPQSAAYCLPRIIKPWCLALRYISGSEEKVQAFRGLCAMIPYNPIGIADSFPYFCEALVEFKNPTQELEYIFQNLIVTFKQCLGVVEWNAYLESFPPQLKKELNTRFRQ
ncbi:hypothetical protein FGO68_gene7412 [Halteria grandinella]|uniref:Uncharacterized protein n=1 Tax=Halteria grandinella TaxID=5974 RepID=A0A8J8NE06_HALGN|nr:hypothetical protein FGO68_gene7412 [Halteria grandinella]